MLRHAPAHRHDAGSHHFRDAEAAQHRDERVDLAAVADDFDNQRIGRRVYYVGAEDADYLDYLAARLDVTAHPYQRQLAPDAVGVVDVHHLDDVDELVQVLRHLFERERVALDYERHAREVFYLARSDGEAGYVVAAPPKHVRDSVQDARLVLDERRYRVAPVRDSRSRPVVAAVSAVAVRHYTSASCGRGSSIISFTDMPDGIIG